MSTLNVVIVSETLVQQHYLKHIVEDSECVSVATILVAELSESLVRIQTQGVMVDAWLIVVDIERLEDNDIADDFQQWLYDLDEPVIFCEGNTQNAAEADFLSWTRQLTNKLLSLKGHISLAEKAVVKAKNIWVLAASTGGPEAVKRFLDTLDGDMDVGFIYAQHIDKNQCQRLSDTITRDSICDSFVAAHGDIIAKHVVAIVPVDHTIELQKNGAVISHQKLPWRGIYQPSIDQIVANVASVYGQYAGVIFFTGMGDDGVTGCRLMSLHGGKVWAQVVSSCVAPSMPQEVINAGYVTKIDTPENLALHLKAAMTARL
jgi:chemosensory pili system protein ChpB (putative protein-glutamate methylesterase)